MKSINSNTFSVGGRGHELWVMTYRMRSQIPLVKIRFPWGMAGLSLRYRVRSLDIIEELEVELVLLASEGCRGESSGF